MDYNKVGSRLLDQKNLKNKPRLLQSKKSPGVPDTVSAKTIDFLLIP